MNMQAMMKQAQKLQKDMMNEKEAIDKMKFKGISSFVTVLMKGTKEVINVKIDNDSIDNDEIEMLEDMIMVAVNDAIRQIDAITEEKMGKYTQGMPGLF
ncbi:MAG: YbaB/EbfC family nucleoid-associated protein [Bacilli bacterium]|nr:YbaB/EbfC family nucleoid-associated protein [Bacilli bacterium]MDD4809091.1 YbaB/EbfC family nucleoid-associated protein [Bacilli bacterium]